KIEKSAALRGCFLLRNELRLLPRSVLSIRSNLDICDNLIVHFLLVQLEQPERSSYVHVLLIRIDAEHVSFKSCVVAKRPERKRRGDLRESIFMRNPYVLISISHQREDLVVGQTGRVIDDLVAFAGFRIYEHNTSSERSQCKQAIVHPGS